MEYKSKKKYVKNTKQFEKKVHYTESSSKHVTCNCKRCKGTKVNPLTRDAHIKKREFRTRSLIIEPSTIKESTSQSHIPDEDFVDDLMEMDEIDINNNESSSENLIFLLKALKNLKKNRVVMVVVDIR